MPWHHRIANFLNDALPQFRATRRTNLALLTAAILERRTLVISALVRSWHIQLPYSQWGNWNRRRQYLREWLYDGSDRARPCRTELDVSLCFAPLLKWALSWWRSDRPALAIDPTLKGDDSAAIVISVLYRGCAIPVAWRIRRAKRPGAWMDPIVELLQALAPAAPDELTVIVLCHRGLTSPQLWRQLRAQGWHPYVRYPKNSTFCAAGGRRRPAQSFVSGPDAAWVGSGTAFKGSAKRRRTLLVVWAPVSRNPGSY